MWAYTYGYYEWDSDELVGWSRWGGNRDCDGNGYGGIGVEVGIEWTWQ